MNERKICFIAALVLLGLIGVYISASGVFIALLLGFLFAPPILVIACISKEGAPIILRELHSVLISGKDFLVISNSRECITLEPQAR